MKIYQRFLGIVILFVGIFLRFYHLLKFDFVNSPFRLGGLFVTFAEQILNNGFRFPINIPFYSEGGIPFAYPPLGFYVEAVLLRLFPEYRFVIANILPPFVSALSLIAVYLLLRRLYANQEGHVLAGLFAYAFLPLAFSNQIEAAGLAESFGSFFLVIYFAAAARFRYDSNWKNAVWIGIGLGLCVLSSPGSAIGAVFLSGLLGLEVMLKNKFSLQSIGWVGFAAFTGMLVSSPYLVSVMLNHGRGIFILPVLAQYGGGEKHGFLLTLFRQLINFMVVQDGAAFFWNVFIYLGLLWLLSRGRFVLPVAFLVLFSVPSEGIWMTALPAAFLFAHGAADVLPLLVRPAQDNWLASKRWLQVGIIIFIGGWMILQSFVLIDTLIADNQWKISADQIRLIESLRAIIPQNAKVLVIGNDALLEWSPNLLQREVVNTQFGLEWQPAKLEQISLLNRKVASATTWNEVLQAVTVTTGDHQIYILSADKKRLSALSWESTVPFKLKLETPVLQLGLLGLP